MPSKSEEEYKKKQKEGAKLEREAWTPQAHHPSKEEYKKKQEEAAKLERNAWKPKSQQKE